MAFGASLIGNMLDTWNREKLKNVIAYGSHQCRHIRRVGKTTQIKSSEKIWQKKGDLSRAIQEAIKTWIDKDG